MEEGAEGKILVKPDTEESPASYTVILTPADSDAAEKKILVVSEESLESVEWGYPFPPASEIGKFKEIDPDLARKVVDTCLEVWQGEVRHRRRWEWTALFLDFWPVAAGQIFAFLLALFVFDKCAELIQQGHSVAGLAGIIAQIAGLVAVFFWGRKQWRDQKKAVEGQEPADPPVEQPESGKTAKTPSRRAKR